MYVNTELVIPLEFGIFGKHLDSNYPGICHLSNLVQHYSDTPLFSNTWASPDKEE